MKKANLTLTVTAFVLLTSISFLSCKKPLPDKTVHSITDAQKIRLREVTIQGLPSPYLQFTYNSNQFITGINHQSMFFRYDVTYKNGRVHKLINKTVGEHDTLQYYYNGHLVNQIDWIAEGTGKREEINLLYDSKNRLVEMVWKNTIHNRIVKKMLFVYNQQNNMTNCDIFYELGNGLAKTNTYHFDSFDTNENLTSNYLLNEYHFLFLPGIRLQQNNPLHATLTGIENDFEFTYSYSYIGKLPVEKRTTMKQTRGSDAGMIRNGITGYSYE